MPRWFMPVITGLEAEAAYTTQITSTVATKESCTHLTDQTYLVHRINRTGTETQDYPTPYNILPPCSLL